MRNPFETAAAARHLKIAVTGKTNAGKTVFGLLANEYGLGPVYVLSLEAGDAHHWHHPRWGKFGRLVSSNLAAIKEGIDYLYANPGGTLVVDTETGIYEALISAMAKADGSVSVKNWGLIKRTWRSLMARLNNLPMNIVHVVHENDIMEEEIEDGRKTGKMKVVGQKLDVEKSFERNPDIILRLGYQGDKRMARVLKDRTCTFASGEAIPEPHIGMWAKAIKAGAAEERISAPEEVDATNAATMATGPAEDAALTADLQASVELGEVAKLEPDLRLAFLKARFAKGFNNDFHKENARKKYRPLINGLPRDLKKQAVEAFDLAAPSSRMPDEVVPPETAKESA